MKAAVNESYGSPEAVLVIRDVPKPSPSSNQILIKVYSSSVNRTDDGFLRAKPAITRLFSGLLRPRKQVLGCEFAGKIVGVGEGVTEIKKGDRVFGFDDVDWGGHAEYKLMKAKKMVAKIPNKISYDQAAVSIEGAHYALGYVRYMQKIGTKRVLVHGATGAIGTAAVQLLKQAGMYVVATSDTKNMKLVKSLGADKVVDREKKDFTQLGETFDVVFDAVGKSSFVASKPLLRSGGVYIATELGYMIQNPILGLASPLFKLVGAKRVAFPLPLAKKEMAEFLAELLEKGEFRPVIDRTFTLDDIVLAYKYVETGQKTGNVVINIE